jgi:short-subunit dehydrogenase
VKVLVLGATSAIAQAAARVWASRGADLLLVARHAAKLQAVSDDLRTRGGQVETALQDLDDASLHPALAERAAGADVVLLAHGILGDPAITDVDPRAAERVLRTNLTGPVQLLTLIAPRLQSGACIAALSSVAGDRGRAKNGVYGASKAGLDAFLSALRQRLSHSGVRVLTLKPGLVDTPMTAGMPKSALFVSAEVVGRGIVRAVDAGREVVYLPWYWRFIMLVIRAVPERVFKRLKF